MMYIYMHIYSGLAYRYITNLSFDPSFIISRGKNTRVEKSNIYVDIYRLPWKKLFETYSYAQANGKEASTFAVDSKMGASRSFTRPKSLAWLTGANLYHRPTLTRCK
jgi:hypothetical protein